jgi:hypothetical protein
MKYLLIIGLLLSVNAYASERCIKDSNGGICCWNTDEEGTLKPISCS